VNYKHVSIVLGFILLGMLAWNVFGPKKVGFKYVTHESDALRIIQKTQNVLTKMQFHECHKAEELSNYLNENIDKIPQVALDNFCSQSEGAIEFLSLPKYLSSEVNNAIVELMKDVLSIVCKSNKMDKESLKTLLKDVLASFCN